MKTQRHFEFPYELSVGTDFEDIYEKHLDLNFNADKSYLRRKVLSITSFVSGIVLGFLGTLLSLYYDGTTGYVYTGLIVLGLMFMFCGSEINKTHKDSFHVHFESKDDVDIEDVLHHVIEFSDGKLVPLYKYIDYDKSTKEKLIINITRPISIVEITKPNSVFSDKYTLSTKEEMKSDICYQDYPFHDTVLLAEKLYHSIYWRHKMKRLTLTDVKEKLYTSLKKRHDKASINSARDNDMLDYPKETLADVKQQLRQNELEQKELKEKERALLRGVK